MSAPRAHRLFVALEPPDRTRRHLAATARECTGAHSALEFVPADRLHVPLCVIGHVPPPLPARLAVSLFEGMRVAPIETRIVAVAMWPTLCGGRLITAEFDDSRSRAARLARSLRAAVAAATGRSPGRHRFWPHIMLARTSRPTGMRRFSISNGEHVFAFDRITLYDSLITSDGSSRDHALMTVPLDSHGERTSHDG